MKYLKLFENYLESVEDRLKEAEEFLDDCFTELFDEWGLTQGSLNDIADNNEKKVYYFILENGRADCNLLIVFDKFIWKSQIADMFSDANHIFVKKVKPKYKFATIESSSGLSRNIWRILIKVNVDDRNTGAY